MLIGLLAGGGVFVALIVGGLIWAFSGKKDKPVDTASNTPQNTSPSDPSKTNGNSGTPGNNGNNSTPSTPVSRPGPQGPGVNNPGNGTFGTMPRELEEKIKRATAYIHVQGDNFAGSGSGFILKSNGDTGYIVTNFHVISGPSEEEPAKTAGPPPRPPGFPQRPPMMRPPSFRPPGFPGMPGQPQPKQPTPKAKPNVTVVLHRGTAEEQSIKAEVVAFDEEADLATLRITGVRDLPPPIDMDLEAPITETMPVYIFGFPGGSPAIVIERGSISQLTRDSNNELSDVQVNGKIIPGNSGGPIVDAQGRLVGIAVSTVMGKNVGFAIPTATLNHMLKGGIRGGIVLQFKQQGNRVDLGGEHWLLDNKSRVRVRDSIQINVGTSPTPVNFPPDEFHVLARLSDPMLKIKSASLHYGLAPNNPLLESPQGWGQLPNAQKVPLQINDQFGETKFKLPPGSVIDQTYAFQFSYVNADGQTVFTQPHTVRLSFPKNLKTMTLKIVSPTDEPSRRYVEELVRKTYTDANLRSVVRTATGLVAELEPITDPKQAASRIKFGEVTAVEGWTVTVIVKNVELPVPTDAEIDQAVADLEKGDGNRRKAAAERLAAVYSILPARRVEVAKLLEAAAVDKDFWLRLAALRALNLWSGPENVAGLTKGLEIQEGQTRVAICNILAKYKDPSCAEALAKLLPAGFERGPASAALKAIGSPAEKAVIPYLTHKDGWTVREACLILKEIGTKESVAPLQALLDKKPDFLVAPTANEALALCKSRK
jgi:S1-C subfamily serine protease